MRRSSDFAQGYALAKAEQLDLLLGTRDDEHDEGIVHAKWLARDLQRSLTEAGAIDEAEAEGHAARQKLYRLLCERVIPNAAKWLESVLEAENAERKA